MGRNATEVHDTKAHNHGRTVVIDSQTWVPTRFVVK
jgi:hypothetical protein